MAASAKEKIGQFAIYSRILLFVFQVIFNSLIPNHNAGVFDPPSNNSPGVADDLVNLLLEGFRRWDAVYFLHIAEYGYVYENALAFFPLFPMCCTVLANTLLYPLQFLMNYSNVLLVCGIIINLYCFIEAAKVLYDLGVLVVKNDHLAYRAALLFCVNPASIFMSAPYSEAMFAMLSFSGMLECERQNYLKSAILFSLAGFTRSNGVVLIGFIVYAVLRDLMSSASAMRRAERDMKTISDLVAPMLKQLVQSAVQCVLYCCLCLLPFALYQFVAYVLFCASTPSYRDMPQHLFDYGRERKYKMQHMGKSEWCFDRIPLSYSYVQSTHWDVGFLKYYEIKQIPNFILASPMIFLCLIAVYDFMSNNWDCVKTLALLPDDEPEVSRRKKHDDRDGMRTVQKEGFHSSACFVYIVHMLALTGIAVCFMHIQVITRFMASSCPVVFWFVSSITSTNQNDRQTRDTGYISDDQSDSSLLDDYYEWDNKDGFSRVIFGYFHLYFFVGTAAFSNYLPWT